MLLIWCQLALALDENSINTVNVNDFWNNYISYVDEPIDSITGKKVDVWQTPKETIGLKTGDCEDYAIIKYFDLINSGVDSKKLYLAWVIINEDLIIKNNFKSHIVLVYENDNKSWVLDNYSKEIIELKNRTDFLRIVAKLTNHGNKIYFKCGDKIIKKWELLLANYNSNMLDVENLKKMYRIQK